MSYPETARRFARAEGSTRAGAAPTPEALAADKLPMSAWAEERRTEMSPATIARNHADYVRDVAHTLRHAIEVQAQPECMRTVTGEQATELVTAAARNLLDVLGESAAA